MEFFIYDGKDNCDDDGVRMEKLWNLRLCLLIESVRALVKT